MQKTKLPRFFSLFMACNILVNVIFLGISGLMLGYTNNPIWFLPAIICVLSSLFIRTVYNIIGNNKEDKKGVRDAYKQT